MGNVSWNFFLNTPETNPFASTKIIFGIPNGTKNFLKSHRDTYYDVIYFIPLDDHNPNPTMQYNHARIFPDISQYVIYPGSQKSSNTTSNVVSESIV